MLTELVSDLIHKLAVALRGKPDDRPPIRFIATPEARNDVFRVPMFIGGSGDQGHGNAPPARPTTTTRRHSERLQAILRAGSRQ